MSTKHTPGPWEASYLDKSGQRVVKGEHIEICTCWHHSVGSIEKEMEANAYLIAAAPDLYAALRQLLATRPAFTSKPIGAPHSPARLEQEAAIKADHDARRAIAKAEGHS
jgi:hypothetical protein